MENQIKTFQAGHGVENVSFFCIKLYEAAPGYYLKSYSNEEHEVFLQTLMLINSD